MDVILGLIQAVITVAVVGVLIFLVASLFPIVFSLGNMFDKRTNNE